jgi:Helicase conserved C-terminal domain
MSITPPLLLALRISCFFLLANCTFVQAHTTLEPAAKAQKISQALKDWNETQPVSLKTHQLIPIDYLEKNSHIKGLIINHYLGTGKTYLAIGFAERNPHCQVIILAPRFLENNWTEHLEKYGVKDKSRYRFISHHAPELLVQEALSNTIVIIDESHKLIERVRAQNTNSSLYTRLYLHLQNAHRILSLTGTPIYNEYIDLVYQINLVAGKNLLPFNQEAFRTSFTNISTLRTYWRGHLTESLFASSLLTPFYTFLWTPLFSPPITIFAIPLGVIPALLTPFILPVLIPLKQFPLRSFSPEQLKTIITQYISYYNFEQNNHLYPTQVSYEQRVSYNHAQLQILYQFYDSRLNVMESEQIFKDQEELGANGNLKDNILLNSYSILDTYKNKPGAGREIGNIFFAEKAQAQTTIFPEKFKRILQTIEGSRGPVVIYSHYYYNGLLYFKQFLDAAAYKEKYRILHPEMPKAQQSQILNEFNNNQIQILLLHPEITEGISLKGTRQLHFLETPINGALQQQIIGRTVRYRSHVHLPESEQKVEVYNWQYVFSLLDYKNHVARRKNWYRNFLELNYYSRFGDGRTQIDKNASLKSETPDERAYRYLKTLNIDIDTFRECVKTLSIENTIYNEA